MIKVALLLSIGAVCTAKHRKNSNPELYNQFLFCNMFLLFVRYLHLRTWRRFFRQEDMKNMFFIHEVAKQ